MIDLKVAAAAIVDAIDEARQHPELERIDIVNEAMAKLGEGHASDAQTRQSAQERLAMAMQRNDALGDYDNAALVDAVAGVGLAILALGADAEVFFAMFSNADASVTTYFGGNV